MKRFLMTLAIITLLLCLPLAALAVDDGTVCPDGPEGQHDWEYVGTQEADCQHAAINKYRCLYCGKVYSEEYGSLGNHNFREEVKDPTCTEGGYYRLRCTVCGTVEGETIYDPLGHIPSALYGYDPTCTEPGLSDGVYCERCSLELEPQYSIPPLGHNPSTVYGYNATCTEPGLSDGQVCSVCGVELEAQQAIPALGHAWGEWSTIVEASCVQDGEEARECARCGLQETRPVAGGHRWGDWKIDTKGTCLTRSMIYRTCTVCKKQEWDLGDYGEHLWGEWETLTPPTATKDGLEERICKYDHSHREERAIPATGVPERELHPAVTITIIADAGAGQGKQYEGAMIPLRFRVINVGDCPVYMAWKADSGLIYDPIAPHGRTEVAGISWDGGKGLTLLNTGEVYTFKMNYQVTAADVENGYFAISDTERYWYAYAEGKYARGDQDSNTLTVPLNLDDQPHPAITVTISADADAGRGKLEEGAKVAVRFQATNTGDCPVYVPWWSDSIAARDSAAPHGRTEIEGMGYGRGGGWGVALLNPGESYTDWQDWAVQPEHVETGVFTVQIVDFFWYYTAEGAVSDMQGPVQSNALSVSLTSPDSLALESQLAVTAERGEWDRQADPAGHQAGELWDTRIRVQNVGPVDVEAYTLRVEIEAADVSTGFSSYECAGIAAGWEDDWRHISPAGYIQADDAARGYVSVLVSVAWTDPVTGGERTASAAKLILPVSVKPGLLLQKSIAHAPANGQYYQAGEEIPWTLTVTNTSAEAIRSVVVTDQGVTVGTFPEIAPGETVECGVPAHTVTEYEAEAAGAVGGMAAATGKDAQGTAQTWFSNPLSVPVSADSGVSLPPSLASGLAKQDPGQAVSGPIEIPIGQADEAQKTAHFSNLLDKTDCCGLTVTSASGGQIVIALHSCPDHEALALRAAEASAEEAVALWRAEIDALYDALAAGGDSAAKEAVKRDRAAAWAYVDAWAALYGDDEALAELLRLQCAALCAMTDPAADGISGSLAAGTVLEGEGKADACGRVFSEETVTLCFDADHAQALADTLTLLSGTEGDPRANAFSAAQYPWRSALDGVMEPAYQAAYRNGRRQITAWRKALDAFADARQTLAVLRYPDAPEAAAEAVMNLYRDALIDACGNR